MNVIDRWLGVVGIFLLVWPGWAWAAAEKWEVGWRKAVRVAGREGKVSVAGPPGESYRRVMRAFEKEYPGVSVDYHAFTPQTFLPRFQQERKDGKDLWDVYITGATPFDVAAGKDGELDPVRSAFVLPEVLDESLWFGGYEKAFLDAEKKYIFAFQAHVTPQAHVNRELVKESDLNSIKEMLNLRWKGRIAIHDPRVSGIGNGRIAFWIGLLGEKFVRALLEQDVGVTRSREQLARWTIQGRYPIAVGLDDKQLEDLRKRGIGRQVAPLGGDSREAWRLNTGWGALRLISRAPHPNAAKVFVNWLLSKDGQTAWAWYTGRPSRRTDVPRIKGLSPKPGFDYYDIDRGDRVGLRDRAKQIAGDVLGR